MRDKVYFDFSFYDDSNSVPWSERVCHAYVIGGSMRKLMRRKVFDIHKLFKQDSSKHSSRVYNRTRRIKKDLSCERVEKLIQEKIYI